MASRIWKAKTILNRREMMRTAGVLAAGFSFGHQRRAIAALRAQILSKSVISMQPHLYHGWPTMTRRSNGELLIVYSGGREAHVCPFGRVEMMRSKDQGQSWSFPRVLLDSPIDDRDSGVVETVKGTLLVTTFTSLAYTSRLDKGKSFKSNQDLTWSQEKLRRWRAVDDHLTPADREKLLGSWMIRSTDGGNWWSAPYRCPANTPHGPIQLADGRLLYVGTRARDGKKKQLAPGIVVYESTSDGQTWSWLADVPARTGDSPPRYSEPYAVEAGDGTLVTHIRAWNKSNRRETFQSKSSDGGRTWSIPHSIGVNGFPSHLIRLKDGRLVMTYGHRRRPLGIQARISEDNAQTWSEKIILSGDGTSTDVGYPSSVQLDDGSVLTAWYELMGSWHGDAKHYHERNRDEEWFKMTEGLRAVLRQTRWSIQ